ncbi:NAD-dependent 15-hydroxyprostaglandin dehydrogenase [Trichodelitschia bisporula]|uniref:NAD-dependent 15-hydroxyprostaglandin dehydrogenase n=1 Tax=Trichodelitschia bisporula TaxID=703511 RepID=A0A6G1HQ99_9PEZI|nr:NAD-dependent 15-hydroxyprostaglandin dehydrogenase [Trichodelitschia bisporula]
MPYSVNGKRALITGGGSGIGLAFTTLLLSKGCNVLIVDLALRPEAQAVVDAHSTTTPRAVFHKTDVTVWSDLQSAFDRCNQEFGGLDIVGPGAGVFEPPWSNFWYPPGHALSKDAPDSNAYKQLEINVTHPIRATQMAIAAFLNPANSEDKASAQNPKRVVLTSSIAGQAFGLAFPIYFASKHAISGFTRSLGDLEGSLGIRVNAVAPGGVYTPMYTTEPHKGRLVDFEKDMWLTAEEVAIQMMRLLEDDDLPGGTILEVTKEPRVVPAWNNPGPKPEHTTISTMDVVMDEVYNELAKPGWGKV